MTFVITIDGMAGAGKSTLGEAIARQLHCSYVDTGLMYRAVTLSALEQGVAPSNSALLTRLAESIDFRLDTVDNRMLIDNAPPSPALRSAIVDRTVSEVSAHSDVRAILTAKQRHIAEGRCVVMAGRDIGTVVFPEAPVKLWVTASEETRAARRAGERRSSGGAETTAIASDLAVRDRLDSGRAVAPTRRHADAVVIDTDLLDPAAALARALDAIASARVEPE